MSSKNVSSSEYIFNLSCEKRMHTLQWLEWFQSCSVWVQRSCILIATRWSIRSKYDLETFRWVNRLDLHAASFCLFWSPQFQQHVSEVSMLWSLSASRWPDGAACSCMRRTNVYTIETKISCCRFENLQKIQSCRFMFDIRYVKPQAMLRFHLH